MKDSVALDLLDAINRDPDYRELIKTDLDASLLRLGFDTATRNHLVATDEDALRRLVEWSVEPAADSGAAPGSVVKTWITRHICTRWFCGPGKTRSWECKTAPGSR